jgi:sugar lactone lactonase YvrE
MNTNHGRGKRSGHARTIRIGALTLAITMLAAMTWSPRSADPIDVEFQTPAESAMYYAADDVYLITNFGTGGPAAIDDDGFISRVDAETGEVVELEWITGTLSAPKGMAIVGSTLYVADMDAVEMYDLENDGAPLGDVKIDTSQITFPNDVCAGEDGVVYLTDSGMNADFSPSGTDAVYRLDEDQLVQVAGGADTLKGPNGCLVDDGGLLVVNGSNEVLRVGDDGDVLQVTTMPNGGLDGIVEHDGDYYVTSWEAGSVFRFDMEGGEIVTVAADTPSPADLGFDTKRNRLIIPLLQFGEGPPFHVVSRDLNE